jgi:hypothetical protein
VNWRWQSFEGWLCAAFPSVKRTLTAGTDDHDFVIFIRDLDFGVLMEECEKQ